MNVINFKRFQPVIGLIYVALMFSPTYVLSAPAGDSAWTLLPEESSPGQRSANHEQWITPTSYQKARLDLSVFSQQINAVSRAASGLIVSIPDPEGVLERFRITPAGDMHPELQLWLASQGSPMQTYKGVSLDRPGNSIRMDFGGPGGLHASVFSGGKAYFVDPLYKNDQENYASYYRQDYPSSDEPRRCELHEKPYDQSLSSALQSTADGVIVAPSTDGNLRSFRLAVAATGEYTSFHGGAVAGQAAIVTTISRVNQIYERDLSVHMELIANNSTLVYTNGATDPYTNNSGGQMLDENRANLDLVIGNENYDIGHVFSTGGGGVAYLGVICNSTYKGGGVTGRGAPINDPFDIDYVAHEIGHQWAGDHTFNSPLGSCSGGNRSGADAYEPGSGSTIQAYAGICGSDDLQPNSDAYFHAKSLDQMLAHSLTSAVVACAASEVINPQAPVVDAGADYIIPAGTAFELTALPLSVPEVDEFFSYTWEQWDLGPSATLVSGDTGNGPIIRSEHPVESASRMIPPLSSLQTGSSPRGYTLPTTSRELNFRVTIRDNNTAGGRFGEDFMNIEVVNTGNPFEITFPNTSDRLAGEQTILWELGGTDGAPFNTTHVDILLSRDNGETWPHKLAANTPNDGSELVTIPMIVTAEARIRIQPVDSIFFDITDASFPIGTSGICVNPDLSFDNGAVQSSIILTSAAQVSGLRVSTDIDHSWVGDLNLSLEHIDAGTTVVLMDRPGLPEVAYGCQNDDVDVVFDDASLTDVQAECNPTSAAIGGVVHPKEDLALFDGELSTGEWQLTVTDLVEGEVGTLNQWCLQIDQFAAAGITVSAQQLGFGFIDPVLGASAEQLLGIQSTGSIALEISNISISGSDAALFDIVSDSGQYFLDPGLTRGLGVVFDPDSVGAKSATLTITSDDPANPDTVIQLLGSGTPAEPLIFRDSFEGGG